MKTFAAFLQSLSTQGAIIGAFCFCCGMITFALAICLVFRITPDMDVLANSKELFIALSSALIGYLMPRNGKDAPPGGTASTETTTVTHTAAVAPDAQITPPKTS